MDLGEGVAAQPQMNGLTVAQPQVAEGPLLVEGVLADALEHPPARLHTALEQIGAPVVDDGRQEVGEHDVGRNGEFDGPVGRHHRETAQKCRGYVGQARFIAFQDSGRRGQIDHINLCVQSVGCGVPPGACGSASAPASGFADRSTGVHAPVTSHYGTAPVADVPQEGDSL